MAAGDSWLLSLDPLFHPEIGQVYLDLVERFCSRSVIIGKPGKHDPFSGFELENLQRLFNRIDQPEIGNSEVSINRHFTDAVQSAVPGERISQTQSGGTEIQFSFGSPGKGSLFHAERF